MCHRVSGWTGQPQSVCVFHKGDLILAVNDLHVSSVEEFNVFINKSLKNEVRLLLAHTVITNTLTADRGPQYIAL